MSRVVHFEFAVENAERAIEFYSKTFGWTFNKWENGSSEYWLITTGPSSEPGIDGGMSLKGQSIANVSNAIAVASVDQAITDIVKNGGTMVTPKMDVGGMGYIAYFKDTEGNVFCLFQPKM